MHKIWAVWRREFLEKVRTRAFLIGTVLFPVLMLALTLMPILLDRRETEPKRVAVVDGASGDVGMKVSEALSASRREGPNGAARYSVVRVPAGDRVESVRDSLITITGVHETGVESLDGILVLTDEAVDGGRIPYLGVNVGSMNDMRKLESELQTALR
jgi:ABC-2 type transport system permease protein